MTHEPKPRELILLPSLKAFRGPTGGLILTQKFLNGVAEYAKYWPGKVTALIEVCDQLTSDMDHVEVQPGPSSGLELRPPTDLKLAERLRGSAVVLAFLGPRETETVHLCRSIGVPLVYSSEYSMRTEFQIIRANVSNPLRRLRRYLWTRNTERVRIKALRSAAGIQCSGTPTFEVYRHVNRNALLFFDNRVPEENVITEEQLEKKLAILHQGRPLRLAFGGRLIAIKGVMELPRVAESLVRRGVSFTFDIFGDGELSGPLQREIDARGLHELVKLRGVVDFQTGWIQFLKSDVDLFVCCHPQGDPSSTYPEVMSCGVPIAGYANEAFQGVMKHSQSGWLAPIGNAESLAAQIENLANQRATIATHARNARAFALQHALERTFRARTEHLMRATEVGAGDQLG